MANITIMSDEDSESPRDYSRGFLTIPFEGDQFKDFISSLLGRPQSIIKRINGQFEIHLADLQHVNDLMTQRLSQNNAQLVQFISRIKYSDNSIVKLNSYEEFITYNEVKAVKSISLQLTWIYLIQFPDKEFPEKQVVELSAYSSDNSLNLYDNDEDFLPFKSSILIKIDHTSRSWGNDVENLLTNHIETLIIKPNSFRTFLTKHRKHFIFISTFLLITIGTISIIFYSNALRDENIDALNSGIFSAKNKIDSKLYTLAEVLIAENQATVSVIVFFIFLFLCGMMMSTFSSYAIDKLKPVSYIVLTRTSQKYVTCEKAKNKYYWLQFIITMILNLALGILSSFIYTLFIKE